MVMPTAQGYGTELGALDWRLSPLPLARGVIAAQLDVRGGAVTGNGRVEREPDGSLQVTGAVIHMPASLAAPVLDIPMLQLLGRIDIDISQLRVQGAWPTAAQGGIRWHNAAVAGTAQASFGDLQAQFATAADGSIAGTAHDSADRCNSPARSRRMRTAMTRRPGLPRGTATRRCSMRCAS